MNIKLLGVALVAALALAAPSFGGGQPIVAKPLAVGMMKATTIHATTGAMVLESITIAPGGSFGWHTHGSPVAVVVTGRHAHRLRSGRHEVRAVQGVEGDSPSSSPRTMSTSHGTTPSKPVTLYALYLGLANTAKANVGVAAPAGCNA